MKRRKKAGIDAQARKERLFAGRVSGQALTKEQWEALGYGTDGPATRPLTQDPVGTYPHPQPKEGS